ncbi:YicC/YloC family endoribonuclease [Trichlorobacter lovleyi]|uniref:YicC/YloC family endoribonuclease n=1 Tax=Trichlorobacter lovleyi TaxID=313985 RepID=UPI0022404865|nr:YicC/YloC family endoribonuclease [Trichlorobacter lovleyi]
MTGYGKAECELPSKKITIEIKSLNSKQLDINSRFPGIYREKDIEVRKIIAEKLERGKVDFSLYCEQLGLESNAVINKPIVNAYYTQLAEIYRDLNMEMSELAITSILRLPDAVKVDHEELDEEEWKMIVSRINAAIDMLNSFRVQEGNALEADIVSHIDLIVKLKNQIEPYESERIERIKTRLSDALSNLSDNVQADPNRFEQELIFYLEKLDINEEKVRLENHCTYFIETINEPYPSGKKLAFIAQEIGREINTLGSKANHSEIQKLVIKMKDELEKIKEQLLNIL